MIRAVENTGSYGLARSRDAAVRVPSRSRLLVLAWGLLALFLTATAFARLGETDSECNRRYGVPQKAKEIIPGCPTYAYDYSGFRIRIAFIGFNGPALKMIFEKRPGPSLNDDEVAAILTANAPEGLPWKRKAPELVEKNANPVTGLSAMFVASAMGAKGWKRGDCATAELAPNKINLTLSLPAAEQLELRAKKEAEAKRKAAIPSF